MNEKLNQFFSGPLSSIFRDISEGKGFSVDLINKNLIVAKKKIVTERKYDGYSGFPDMTEDECLDAIRELYREYKHSIPSERTQSKRRNYFYALQEKDLESDDMFYGEYREIAQARLEIFLLFAVIEKRFHWKEELWGWFYQDKEEGNLILLKQWVS